MPKDKHGAFSVAVASEGLKKAVKWFIDEEGWRLEDFYDAIAGGIPHVDLLYIMKELAHKDGEQWMMEAIFGICDDGGLDDVQRWFRINSIQALRNALAVVSGPYPPFPRYDLKIETDAAVAGAWEMLWTERKFRQERGL